MRPIKALRRARGVIPAGCGAVAAAFALALFWNALAGLSPIASPAGAAKAAETAPELRGDAPTPLFEAAATPDLAQAGGPDAAAGPDGRFDCLLEPRATIEISSEVAGVVAETFVDRGDRVKKGQLLARLADAVERAELEVAVAKADAVGDLQAKQLQADYEERRLERHQRAIAAGAISGQKADEIRAAHDVAQMTLKAAEEYAERLKKEVGRAKASLDRREIRSTIDGVVLERTRSPGESVDKEPLFTLVALDPLHVEAFLPVALWDKISKDDAAEVYLLGQDRALSAGIDVIDLVADAASGTFKLRLTLPNPGLKIMAGVKCGVAFPSLKTR